MGVSTLARRQYYYGDSGWWYSETAYIIKWAVLAVVLLVCLAYFGGGYLHARRRMKRGQPPLRYHRWLIPRRSRYAFAQAHPEHAHLFSFPRHMQRPVPYGYGPAPGQNYQMGHYGPPPPAYHEPEYVPAYTPAGPNKVDPNQNYAAPPPQGFQNPGGPSQPDRVANPGGR